MSVKYKIGFTMDAETLFGLLSKFLPIEHLSVEEVFERPAPPTPKLTVAPRLVAPKPTPKLKLKRASRGPLLDAGLNRIILDALADGEPHSPIDLKTAILKAGGYSADSLSSRLAGLVERGYVIKPDYGAYQLSEKP
jgi:hypothetical protein